MSVARGCWQRVLPCRPTTVTPTTTTVTATTVWTFFVHFKNDKNATMSLVDVFQLAISVHTISQDSFVASLVIRANRSECHLNFSFMHHFSQCWVSIRLFNIRSVQLMLMCRCFYTIFFSRSETKCANDFKSCVKCVLQEIAWREQCRNWLITIVKTIPTSRKFTANGGCLSSGR